MNPEARSQIQTLASGRSLPVTDGLLEGLRDLELDFDEQDGVVCLRESLELLDAGRIGDHLSDRIKAQLTQLDIFWTIDSTNTWLLGRAAEPGFRGSVCLAEQQVAGKGRRGRHWVSPFGKNIYLSIGWRMSTANAGVAGLSLVVGMQVATALREMGLHDVGLKWPNDVLLNGGKLAGILVEMAASPQGQARLVIGIGVNLRLDARDASRIDQQFSTVSDYANISRNELVSRLIDKVVGELVNFESRGFAFYAEDWNRFDLYSGQPVRVNLVNEVVEGIDRGVDAGGNLLLETEDGMQSFNAGEVSLRPIN